jgi:branched-chain amino acid transport system permease protein
MKAVGKYRDLISTYAEANQLFRTTTRKVWFGLLILLLIAAPWVGTYLGGNYVTYLLNLTAITIIVALGLNFLMGVTGLISLGHAAFFAVGAYTAGYLASRWNISFLLTLPAAAAVAAVSGFIVGLPALRLKGHYLILATLAFQFITDFLILRAEPITGGANGLAVPGASLRGFELVDDTRFYYLVVGVVVLLSLGMVNLMRSKFGRAAIAIRECDVAAEAVGVNLPV